MTRAATPENEAHLLQVARHGTAQHVEKLVRKFARASRLNSPQQDKCQYESREFSWYHDDDGMLVFKGRLPAAEGPAFLQAMEAISPLVPTLRVGTHTGNTVTALPMHSHAERGNEVVWLNLAPFHPVTALTQDVVYPHIGIEHNRQTWHQRRFRSAATAASSSARPSSTGTSA